MPDDEQPPTLAEMAARARGANPWSCRRCGCEHTVVVSTWFKGTGAEKRIQRKRECRHCRQDGFTTSELITGFEATVVPSEEPGGA